MTEGWTQEQFGQWEVAVMNYAEYHGYDPIGASDMLSDLSQFARHTALARLQLDEPATVVAEFEKSHRYLRYWGGKR